MESDDAQDDEDGEARDLPSAPVFVPLHLLFLLLFQQGFQDQLESLGVNVPGGKGYCLIHPPLATCKTPPLAPQGLQCQGQGNVKV